MRSLQLLKLTPQAEAPCHHAAQSAAMSITARRIFYNAARVTLCISSHRAPTLACRSPSQNLLLSLTSQQAPHPSCMPFQSPRASSPLLLEFALQLCMLQLGNLQLSPYQALSFFGWSTQVFPGEHLRAKGRSCRHKWYSCSQ